MDTPPKEGLYARSNFYQTTKIGSIAVTLFRSCNPVSRTHRACYNVTMGTRAKERRGPGVWVYYHLYSDLIQEP
jgi:hypothetical protein